MEFDKKTILAFLLIGLILVLVNTEFYQRMVYGDLPQSAPANTSKPQPDKTQTAAEAPSVGGALSDLAQQVEGDTLVAETVPEQEIVVETPLYRGVFSTRGGNLKEWMIKGFVTSEKKPLVLFKEGAGNLGIALPQRDDTLRTSSLHFAPSNSEIELAAGQTKKLVFERQIAPGKFIRKTFQFAADSYTLGLKVEIEGARDLVEGYYYALAWQSGLASTERNIQDEMSDASAYTYTSGQLSQFDVQDKSADRKEEKDRDISWAAIRTKYFAVAVIPRTTPARGASLAGSTSFVPGSDARLKSYALSLDVPIARAGATAHDFEIYLGPLALDNVKALGVGLENIMNWGWAPVKPFSRIVLWTLVWLREFIPNYGLVIVIFSILVKVILHPLTKKSSDSMKQMQALQPKINELREKYAKDPQKMNAEVMKLYQEYGVNPFKGCLPTLLQMPFLYALYTIFRSTIEFRQAPFFGWINDLSAPDAIYTLPSSIWLIGDSINVLPLVMGVTMFIQQKMSITDPKQKAMIYMMPILFTLMFNNFPSGLNLYYTLFNIFSIIQQKYTGKAPVELVPKKKKQSKFSLAQMRKYGVNAALSRNRMLKKSK
jgi:YidC/Oxa1 family membrane protein insertase